MEREQRCQAYACCDENALAVLAERVLSIGLDVVVLRPPTPGTVMVRLREPVARALFNLGEVTVTEAEVEIAGQRGYAMVMGRRPRQALAGAIVDAAYEALPELRSVIAAALAEALAERERQRAARWQRVALTRVQFDEIPG
jgi:alpha-D-ribose 1-methylphosphonate 5-triphosphate synthase subunit PhnG